MHLVILSLLLAVCVYAPTLRVRYIMNRHSGERADLPGSGGELATHLVQRFELKDVLVEETENGKDHYDPNAIAVRLGKNNFHGKSLTAVAIAAHEIGHAIQFDRNEDISKLRKKYIPTAMAFKRVGIIIMTVMPVVGIIFKVPSVILAVIVFSLFLQLLGALTYLIVLPEEWDASFKKALPLLIEGEYINESDIPAVHAILKAAALTYFAAALADLLNIGRWFLILRKRI